MVERMNGLTKEAAVKEAAVKEAAVKERRYGRRSSGSRPQCLPTVHNLVRLDS
jgi:hypothetical protein